MEKLSVDLGVIEFKIGGGILRFNPSNPKVYQRFISVLNDLPKIEQEYRRKEQEKQILEETSDLERAAVVFDEMEQIDKEVKRRLSEAFGPGNDLNEIVGDESLMGFGINGERVVTNLLNALTPYIEQGVEKHMKGTAGKAVEQAKLNRAQRRAAK